MRRVLPVILALVCSIPVRAQRSAPPAQAYAVDTPGQATENRYDGHWWMTAPENFKLGYLTGYISGLNFVSQMIDPDGTKYAGFRFGRYTVGQIYDELDKFYSDSSNQHIQIPGAVTWVTNKIEGTRVRRTSRGSLNFYGGRLALGFWNR